MKYLFPSMLGLLLAGCVSAPASQPAPVPARTPAAAAPPTRAAAAIPPRPALDIRGLEAIISKDAGTLKRLFGEPRLDVIEVYGRKLQFAGKACVLDAYLYPEGKGRTEIVTYVDARRSDGAAVDRAACVQALQAR